MLVMRRYSRSFGGDPEEPRKILLCQALVGTMVASQVDREGTARTSMTFRVNGCVF